MVDPAQEDLPVSHICILRHPSPMYTVPPTEGPCLRETCIDVTREHYTLCRLKPSAGLVSSLLTKHHPPRACSCWKEGGLLETRS